LTYVPITSVPAEEGIFTMNPDGTYTFVPEFDFYGDVTVEYQVCDPSGLCDTATLIITVVNVNEAPVAGDDSNNTLENKSVLGNVLNNDFDPDDDVITVNVSQTTTPAHGTIILKPNGSYVYTPNNGFVGSDTIAYTICDNGIPSLCDTAILVINVRKPNPSSVNPILNDDKATTLINVPVVINVKSNDSDPSGSPLGNPTVINPSADGTSTVNSDGTITFTPNPGFVGVSVFQYTICNDASRRACDTATVVVTVVKPPVIKQQQKIYVGDSIKFCLDRLNLKGKVNYVKNNCLSTTNNSVSYTVDTANCITIKGIAIGMATACYDICTDSMDCITLTYETTVITKPDTINVSVNVGDKEKVCLNTNRPFTTPLRNICPELADNNVDFEVKGDTCIEVTGTKAGKAASCWVRCDRAGICDTVIIHVTVIPTSPPDAVDDDVTTSINTPVTITLLKNDTLHGKFKSVTIMTDPRYGFIEWKEDSVGTPILEYTPKDGHCSTKLVDEFVYQLCNESSCDLATIRVKVVCEGIFVNNGFSPNGDGKNDYFTIDGLENYKNTQVYIFNRWGNQVYESLNYQNDWGGNWKDYKLPDGTYFYQIVLETGQVFTGYIQVSQ
jgi:gliding motility-associated-like protein